MNFRKRFPSLKQLAPVYSVVVVIIYSWSILRFFWTLPSFLNYSTPGKIGVVFSYLITVNFFESLFVISVPVIFSLFLPEKWFYERFVTKGILLVSLGLGYMVYIASHFNPDEPFPYTLFRWSPLVFLIILALVFLLDRITLLTRMLEDISDRFEIFLFISVPMSAVSLLVVLTRNIF